MQTKNNNQLCLDTLGNTYIKGEEEINTNMSTAISTNTARRSSEVIPLRVVIKFISNLTNQEV